MESYYPDNFRLHDASAMPIGAVTLGGRKTGLVRLVTVNGDSTDIMDRGPKRSRCSRDFVVGTLQLLQDVPSVSFVVHFARGYLKEEVVAIKRKVFMTVADFENRFPEVEEDVRYVVRSEGAGG